MSKLTKVLKSVAIGILMSINNSCSEPEVERFEDINLTQLFNEDIERFTSNAVGNKEIQQIFEKRGLDATHWFETKMQDGGPYLIDPTLPFWGSEFFPNNRQITFHSFNAASQAITQRAQGMMKRASFQQEAGNNFRLGFATGRHGNQAMEAEGFNHGMINLMVEEIALNRRLGNSYLGYSPMLKITQELRLAINCDKTIFESFLFDPQILQNRLNKKAGNDMAFQNLVTAFNELHRHLEDSRQLPTQEERTRARHETNRKIELIRGLIGTLNKLEKNHLTLTDK